MILDKMTLKELIALNDRIAPALERARSRELAEVRERAIAMAVASGFSVSDLFTMHLGRQHKMGAIRYRNPQTGQTWSGRGRQPLWFKSGSPGQFSI